MSYVVEFSFDHPDIILSGVKSHCRDACIRMAYSTPMLDREGDAAFVVVTCEDDWAEVDAAFAADETVEDEQLVFRVGIHSVYSFEWAGRGPDVWRKTAQLGVFIERIWAIQGNWHIRLHFPSRRLVRQFQEYLEEEEFSVDLQNLSVFDPETDPTGPTPSQLELLREAYSHGYFEVPRKITQQELSERHQITESAVSQQIRRGLNNVLKEFLSYGPPNTAMMDEDFFQKDS